MDTLREEIGFQRAILDSLANAQDADSKRVRIGARREIQLLLDKLRKLEVSKYFLPPHNLYLLTGFTRSDSKPVSLRPNTNRLPKWYVAGTKNRNPAFYLY